MAVIIFPQPFEDLYQFSGLFRCQMQNIILQNLQEPLLKYRNTPDNTTHKKSDLMEDRANVVRSYAIRTYPYFLLQHDRKRWVYLFGKIPFLKVKNYGSKSEYLLFGILKIWTIL